MKNPKTSKVGQLAAICEWLGTYEARNGDQLATLVVEGYDRDAIADTFDIPVDMVDAYLATRTQLAAAIEAERVATVATMVSRQYPNLSKSDAKVYARRYIKTGSFA